MNREIKFRAWNKKSKKMVYYESDCTAPVMTLNGVLLNHATQANISYEYELGQYTGLKDKNGKEIYKSDVVKGKHKITREEILGEIVWNDKAYQWGIQLEGWIMHLECLIDCYDFEIVGNIYEK